jgi:hypothetical protein
MLNSSAPNGYFAGDLILYGSLEKGVASKGYVLQPPDLRGGTTAQLNAYQDKIRSLLSLLGDGLRAQFQWTCNCDYRQELTQYHRATEALAMHPHIRRVRAERFGRYWEKMHRRELRREQLVMFISTPLAGYAPLAATRNNLNDAYAKLLAQLRARFGELTATLRTLFGGDTTVTPMDDLAHFVYYSKFLNPSLADGFDIDFAGRFSPRHTMQENCWCSDGVNTGNGCYMDGRHHAVFTFKRWPSRTYPGIMLRLTALPFLDYQITVNLEPLPARGEVEKEETAIERLRGEYKTTERHSLVVAINRKERKVESLSSGFIRPFSVGYIIRVWDETEAGLSTKNAAVRNAINGLNGAQYNECALPTTAKKLFFASWPGWTNSPYRHRNLYAEDSYLADLLPFSATFTGLLDGAEAIYDGAQQGNLVGLRTFVGNPPTPQHAVLLGATGAGKSVHMCDLLEQTAAYYHHTVIIEEGLSYGKFTEAMGGRPIILQPDGDLTINYLDTRQLPLNQLQIATAVALVSRMIGEAADEETQQIRQAMLGEYINQLYIDAFEDWSKRNRDLLPAIQRMACAAHRWKRAKMSHGTTDMESYAELRDRIAANDSEALEFTAKIPEDGITAFLQDPQTERAVMATAHAYYTPADYPQHASLVELMQFSRFPEHKKETVDHLATLLSSWCAHGQYGRLFDGVTNISLTGQIAHFELGYIPEQAVELKTAAGLLISGFSRQHIISLPRHLRKRIIYEELARFLDVPGGEKVVAESYAQLRKFSCWTASIVQQYSRFKSSRIRPVVIGNSKQFFLMRQFDRSDIDDIAHDINLPESVCAAIQNYPMPEQQPEGKKFSSICFFTPVTDPALCGTVRNIQPSRKQS